MKKKKHRYKVTVIGGGTGLPVILKGLKRLNADITAVVTVADDGGSSGIIRDYINVVPPGDIRNCMTALSQIKEEPWLDLFQYRFNSDDDFLAGHAIGNLLIAALKEMTGSLSGSIDILSRLMRIKGQVLPAAEEPLVLNARFDDGTIVVGESKIAGHRKRIEEVQVTTKEGKIATDASPRVVESILDADMVIIGPGSLYTSILPNLMISDIGGAINSTKAEVVYICNIMTQLGETEGLTDADHVKVLHQHMNKAFIDTVLVNIATVPSEYIMSEHNEEYLLQVEHDFNGLIEQGCYVISIEFLSLRDNGAYHDTDLIVDELTYLLDTGKVTKRRNIYSQ